MSNVTTAKAKKLLRVPLTEEETIQAGRDLAEALGKRDRAEMDIKVLQNQLKTDMKELDSEISKTRELLSTGCRYQDVDVEHRYHWDEGIVQTWRLDTGVMVGQRVISDEERQMEMKTPEEEDEETTPAKGVGESENADVEDDPWAQQEQDLENLPDDVDAEEEEDEEEDDAAS